MGCNAARLLNPWNSPGQNTGMGSYSFLQGIFSTRDQTQASHISSRFFPIWATREAFSRIHEIFPKSAKKWRPLKSSKYIKSLQSCLALWDPGTVAHEAPLPRGFSRQEYWIALPCPSPGNLPDPGIEPTSLMFPALAGGFFKTSVTWEALSRSRPYLKDCQKRERLRQFPSEAGHRARWSVGP